MRNNHSFIKAGLGLLLLAAAACQPNSQPPKNLPGNLDSVLVPDTGQKSDAAPDAAGSDKPVLGIDVSHFQNNVNWDEIKQAGISYVYSKATQGVSDVDPKFKRNHEGTIAAGLYHGAYHFYVAGEDPLKQAKNFTGTLKTLVDHAMPPVLDLEQGGMKSGIDVKTYQQDVLKWLKSVESTLGMKPVIYTNHPFGNQYLNNPAFADYQLWIAEYGVDKPKIPETWKDKGWLMWQRTESGKLEGAIGNVDHDLLNGTAATLGKL